MTLYHTSDQEIRIPNLEIGRKNADFGKGFYLSDNLEFSKRWARESKGHMPVINCYHLDLEGLKVLYLERNADWYNYIFKNRRAEKDIYASADVIIGPIANDTLFDTMGILTSGILSAEQALDYYKIGPEYMQIVLKSSNAVRKLKWVSLISLDKEELISNQKILRQEEESFQTEFAEKLNEWEKDEE